MNQPDYSGNAGLSALMANMGNVGGGFQPGQQAQMGPQGGGGHSSFQMGMPNAQSGQQGDPWGGWAPGQQAALSGNTGQQYSPSNWGYGQNGSNFGQNYANAFQTQQQQNNNPGQLTDAALAQFGQNPNMTQEQMQQIVNGTPGTPAVAGLDGAAGTPATAGTPSMSTINNLGYYQGLNPNQLGNLQNYLSGPAGGSSLMKDPFKVNYGTPGVNLGSGLGTIYDMPSM